MLEKDLFIPLKNYLEGNGYKVKAEVIDVDIMALKNDLVLIVEMKTSLSIKLLFQGSNRQKLTDFVYIAIPKPSDKILKSKSFKEKVYLVKRLHLGLLLVDVAEDQVIAYLDPSIFYPSRNIKTKEKLLKEFNERITAYNEGGVTKTKIVTAYRERAVLIAHYLSSNSLSVKELRALTNDENCQSILQKNYYNWFNRVKRGYYELNDFGIKELDKYSDIVKEILIHKEKKQLK